MGYDVEKLKYTQTHLFFVYYDSVGVVNNHTFQNKDDSSCSILEFTGNWFIDAGIWEVERG